MKRTRVSQGSQQIIMSPPSTGQSLAVSGFCSFAVGFLDSAAFMSPAGLSVAIKIYRKRKKGDMLKNIQQITASRQLK